MATIQTLGQLDRPVSLPRGVPGPRPAAKTPASFICIVGAPRCGTTTLAGFLQHRPDLCFSRVKEPHFFAQRDLTSAPPDVQQQLTDEYLERFFPHRVDGTPLAEASVSYLYAADQMAPVLRLWPDARFVIAVRDPLEMLPSLHQRLLYIGDETVTDFERAWALMPERAQGRRIPRTCIDPRMLQYSEIGRLGTHVERFLRAVGRERCFVSVFDDLRADPEAHYRRLMAFLDLPPQAGIDFAGRRAGSGFKIGWLQRLLKRPPIARRILSSPEFRVRARPLREKTPSSSVAKAIMAGRKKLLRWNRAPAPPVRLSDGLRAQIRDTLADDIAHLGRILDRDLSHWLGGPPR